MTGPSLSLVSIGVHSWLSYDKVSIDNSRELHAFWELFFHFSQKTPFVLRVLSMRLTLAAGLAVPPEASIKPRKSPTRPKAPARAPFRGVIERVGEERGIYSASPSKSGRTLKTREDRGDRGVRRNEFRAPLRNGARDLCRRNVRIPETRSQIPSLVRQPTLLRNEFRVP